MGGFSCPCCCGKAFRVKQALAAHIASTLQQLCCPFCDLKEDSISRLADHFRDHSREVEVTEAVKVVKETDIKDDELMAKLAALHSEPSSSSDKLNIITPHVTDHVYCSLSSSAVPENEAKVIVKEVQDNRIVIEVETEEVLSSSSSRVGHIEITEHKKDHNGTEVMSDPIFVHVHNWPEQREQQEESKEEDVDSRDEEMAKEEQNVSEEEKSVEAEEKPMETGEKPMETDEKPTEEEEGVDAQCTFCGIYVKQDYLQNHTLTHGDGLNFPCHECCQQVQSYRHNCEANDQTLFYCFVCKQTFRRKITLEKHHKMHKFATWYRCMFCEKKFSILSRLKNHEKSHTYDSTTKSYPCEVCDKRFVSLKSMRIHLKMHEPESQPCNLCGKKFHYASALRDHQRIEHEGLRPHQCFQCGKQFKTRSHLLNHERAVHRGEKHYVCDICGMGFYYQTGFKKHVERHKIPPELRKRGRKPPTVRKGEDWVGDPKYVVIGAKDDESEALGEMGIQSIPTASDKQKFMCDVCQTTLPTRSGLKHHKKRVHGRSTWKFQCKECRKPFVNGNSLRNHMWVHTGVKPYQCPHCLKRYSTQGNLNLHKAVHEKPQMEYNCDKCERVFQSAVYFDFHLQYHTGVRPHMCETCGAAFKTKQKLGLHQQTHVDTQVEIERYWCQECGKGFHTVSSYRYHLKKHAKQLECTLCGKTFSDPSQLTNHRKNHSQAFSCGMCSRRFTSATAAKEHVESHKMGRLKYTCEVCGAAFCQLRGLRPHMETHERRGDGHVVLQLPTYLLESEAVVEMGAEEDENIEVTEEVVKADEG